MLTLFNPKICNLLIIVCFSVTRVSGNFTCAICFGDSIQKCLDNTNIIDNSCPVCAKVVNVSGVHITGVKTYCEPTCQQAGCHNNTTQSSCKLCCSKSTSPDCSIGEASKLLFCYFNLAVSFIMKEHLAHTGFDKDKSTSNLQYVNIMVRMNDSVQIQRTGGFFRSQVKPGSLVTLPNGSLELNMNINVYYRKRLFDLEFITTDLKRTITTSVANGSLRSLAEGPPSFRVGSDRSVHPYAQIATVEQEGCAKQISDSALTQEDALKILTSIDKDVENITSSKVDVVDVYEIHESMEKIASNKNLLVPAVVERMLTVLGKLMGIDTEIMGHVVGIENNSDKLRRLLEVLGKHVILDKSGEYIFNSTNFGISVSEVSGGDQPNDFYCTGFLRTSHDDKQKVEMVVSNESSELGEGYAQVQIPLKEMFEAMLDEQRNITRLTVMMLRKASIFETVHPLNRKRDAESDHAYHVSDKINSWIVGVFAAGYNLTQLPVFYTITFRKLKRKIEIPISVRWGAGPFSNRNTWIHNGCNLSSDSNTTCTCVSKRLAFFSTLNFDFIHTDQSKRNFDDYFRYIAMFGNAVCALECLFAILAMLFFVKRIDEKDDFYLLRLNFTTSVLFTNVSILYAALGHLLVGDLVCEFVILFLFYTLFVSQLWVVVFALFLFFYVGYPHRFAEMFRRNLQVCLATWGIPAVYTAIITVTVTMHEISGFTFHARSVCILHGLNEFIYFLPLFILLLVLALVLIVKTFLLPWQTTNEIGTSQSSVSSTNSSSTDTFVDSVTDQFSACLVFFLLLSVSNMFLYSALWQNNMLVSCLYTILVVFLGAAIMVMPRNFLSHIVRIELPKIRIKLFKKSRISRRHTIN